MVLIIIICTLALLSIILFGVMLSTSKKQKKNIIRIETAEEEIDKSLNERQKLLIEMENIINKNTEVSQNNFKDIDKENLSYFELDKKLSKIADTFSKIKSDYQIELDTEDFRKLTTELKMNEEKNEASKKYYNKYAENLNKQINKFPSNIFAKITKQSEKRIFDITNMKFNKNDIVFESEI